MSRAIAGNAPPTGPVSRGVMLLYGVGQVGAQIFRDTPAVLLPIFMITALGVPPWLAGLAVLVPKLWVIICDPLVGSWSDRMKGRHSRLPFLVVGAVLTSLGFFSLFVFHDLGSPYFAAGVICLLYLLASTGFSAFSVPYLALAAELSDDPHERTKILVYRMVFTIIGVVLGVGFAQPLVFYYGGGPEGWRIMAAVFALICLAAMLTTALGLKRAIPATGREEVPVSLGKQLKLATKNRPFRILIIAHFVQAIGQACGYSVVGMVFLYAVANMTLLPVFIIVMSLAGLLSQPFWLKMSRRHGKIVMFVLASLAWSAITVTWLFVGQYKNQVVALPYFGSVPTEDALVLVRAFVIGIVNSGFVLMAISMLTDTINHGRRSGDATVEGSLAGLWSASEKLAFAAGPAIAGLVLSLAGFQASTGGVVAQDEGAIFGILLVYSVIPAALCLGSLLLIRGYKASFLPAPEPAAGVQPA